jgi:hypothetical protein
VADSQKTMLDANIESFRNLEQNLSEHGMTLSELPLVIQFNKRDLPEVLSIDELNAALNKNNAPIYEAVATTGIGVHETLKACTRLVLNSLKTRYAEGDKRDDKTRAAGVAAAAAAAAASKTIPPPAMKAEAPAPAAAASTTARTQAMPSQHSGAFAEAFEGDLVPLDDDLLGAETSRPELEPDLAALVPDSGAEAAHPVTSLFTEKAIATAKGAPPAPAAHATVDEDAVFEILEDDDADEVLEDVLELADETPALQVELPSFHRVEHAPAVPAMAHASPSRSWSTLSEESAFAHPPSTEKTEPAHATSAARSAHVALDGPTEICVPILIDIGGQTIALSLRLSLTVEQEAGRHAVQGVGVSS